VAEIKSWKTTAGDNNSAPPDGFPEGMLRSKVNDSMREVMAAVRTFWDSPDWKNPVHGYTVTQDATASDPGSTIKVAGVNASSLFLVNQKVKITSSSHNDAYAFVKTVTWSDPDTIIEVEDFDTTGTPTPHSSVSANANGIFTYFLGGSTGLNGIGRSAFGSGVSESFEIPGASTTAAFQTAITNAQSNGKIVLLPVGTHVMTATLNVSSSPVSIMGMGDRQTILKRGSTGTDTMDLITVAANNTGLHLHNLQLDGDESNYSHDGHGVVFGDNPSNIRISDVLIKNIQNDAIRFGGTTAGSSNKVDKVWITGTTIERCGGTGIHIEDPNGINDRVFISDVSVSDFGENGELSTAVADACGINISGACQVNNVCLSATSTATRHAAPTGAFLRSRKATAGGTPPGGLRNNWMGIRITGDVSLVGIELGAVYSTVSDGFIYLTGAGAVPINVEGVGSTAAELSSHHIIRGIHVVGGLRCEVESSASDVIFDSCNFQLGARFRVKGDWIRFQGCTFVQTGSGGIAGTALEVQSGSDNVEVRSCRFYDYNIQIGASGDYFRVSDCHFESSTSTALSIVGDYCSVVGSVFKDDIAGVMLQGDSANVSGCNFDTCGTSISIQAGTSNTIGTNVIRGGTTGVAIAAASNNSKIFGPIRFDGVTTEISNSDDSITFNSPTTNRRTLVTDTTESGTGFVAGKTLV